MVHKYGYGNQILGSAKATYTIKNVPKNPEKALYQSTNIGSNGNNSIPSQQIENIITPALPGSGNTN